MLDAESVVLVTGAAGSIVSAITADLAAASGGTFHLLDLTPTPDPADPDLAAFRQDRDGLKSTIAERIRAAGDRPTPVAIERELSRYERLDAALTAIQSVEACGGTAHYHSVDLTDADAVAAVMADVRERSGRIDVLLHAAGLEISRDLPDKEPREYDLVFDVKSDGWFNVFHGARQMPIGATVVFSSVAGRFGNRGQTDYAAANDLLCKITSNLRRTMPGTRGLALDWTAWGGIGMATRGSIPKIMEMAGVQMLPAEAGVAWIRRELDVERSLRRGHRCRHARHDGRRAGPVGRGRPGRVDERRARADGRYGADERARRHRRADRRSIRLASRSSTTTASTGRPFCPA